MMRIDCADADLAAIVAKASFLWERLDPARFVICEDQTDEPETRRRCERWCQVVAQGDWDGLRRRVNWEGTDLDAVRPRLGTVRPAADQILPAWAETLRQIMQAAVGFDPDAEAFLPIEWQDPVPFEDLLFAAIPVARRQLLTRLGAHHFTEHRLPLLLLTETAYRVLERDLLRRLSRLCAKTLDAEFSQIRPFGRKLAGLFELDTEDVAGKGHYKRFVHSLLSDGLRRLFRRYPVLGRTMATVVDFWVETTVEFLERLARDESALHRLFGADRFGKVAEIQTALSDPHQRGRTVFLLKFESGLRLVYKPKELGVEVAFNQFLSWLNRTGPLLDFKVVQVLDRQDYGWAECIEHRPCDDAAAAERYYQRAGMLLAVLYVLRGADCHHENLIASGEYPVLVDVETLLQHEPSLIEESSLGQGVEGDGRPRLGNSVLETVLLPRVNFSAEGSVAYDASGLGSADQRQAVWTVARWQAINTDDMHLRQVPVAHSFQKNRPWLGETALSPDGYQEQIATGFAKMYRFLMANKHALLAPDGPLAALRDRQVRFVFRPTRIYISILQAALSPDHLKDGADYSIEIDQLSRAFMVARTKPKAWPVLNAELRAMEQLDIPFFTANAGSDALAVNGQPLIRRYFMQPSYQQVLDQIRLLDEADLARQMAIIRASFLGRTASISSGDLGRWNAEAARMLSSEELVDEARTIAADLEARAIRASHGGVTWVGLTYVPEAERFQLRVLNDSLYDGRCGVALFLAALHSVTGERRFRDLCVCALQALRRRVRTGDRVFQQRMARFAGIGGATGLGSMIYALARIGDFLNDETMYADARAITGWITPELIAADEQFDVMGGAAGAILGLLSLYGVTRQAAVLATAIAAGQHLLARRVTCGGTPKAWLTPDGKRPLTGFSHGAAGISYALLRLYDISGDRAYRGAALEGIAYERSVFSSADGNWPDFRHTGPDSSAGFLSQWCHGATGVGLARLGSLRIINTPEIRSDIDIAVQTTQAHGLRTVDHLCCGNLGRVETMLVAARCCNRADWRERALRDVSAIVARARDVGAYQLFPDLQPGLLVNPGFFQGTAGIGYALLRLADERLPSVLMWE
jgi:type 2 lantibiotic biosynthesis protein LanM